MSSLIQRSGLLLPNGFCKQPRPILDVSHPLSKGLIGFWPLGEPSAADISPFGRRGSVVGTLGVMAGKYGGLASVFSSGNYINLQSIFYPFSSTGVTMTGLIYPSGGVGSYRTIWRGDSGGSGPAFYLWPDESLVMYNNGVTGTTPLLSQNTWYHVAAVFGASTWVLYLNGNQILSVANPGVLGDTTQTSRISNDQFGQQFVGGIEAFRMYNRALSGSEIARLSAEPYAGTYAANYNRVGIVGGAGVTGSGAIVEGQDVCAGSGKSKVTGTSAITEAKDSFAASGKSKVTGSGAITEGGDVCAASGKAKVTATGAIVEGSDICAGSGSTTLPTVTGSGAIVEGSDICAGGGTAGIPDDDIDGVAYPASYEERKERRKEFDRARKAKAGEMDRVTAEMREILSPTIPVAKPISGQKPRAKSAQSASNDEDEDIEFLLLYG